MIDLEQLKDVPFDTLARIVIEADRRDRGAIHALGSRLDELRAAITPKLRTDSERNADLLRLVKECSYSPNGYGVTLHAAGAEFVRLRDEPTAPDPAPAPSEREQELQREVERLRGLAKKAKRELERGWSWTPQAITILEEALRHD